MDRVSVRVLVVDDNETWRHYVSGMVREQQGLQVIGAVSDGLEAVRKAKALQPDLILLDIGLPGVNGIEAARQIRRLSPASKILFVSENRSIDVAEAALSTGAGGYVLKSDAARDLLPAVEAVVEGKRFVSASLAGHNLTASPDPQTGARFHRNNVATLIPTQNVGNPRHHEVAFYSDDAGFVDGFARFIQAALKAGNPVIVIATESHRASLFQRLRGDGVDVSATIEQGIYIPLDVSDTLSTFMANHLPDPVRFAKVASELITGAAKAAKGEGRQVAACGECAPVLLAKGNAEAAIRLEHLWDEIARSYDVDILCGYVSTSLQEKENSPSFLRICAEHSAAHCDKPRET